MKPSVTKQKSQAIVYDGDVLAEPAPAMFDPGFWETRDAVDGVAPGRGTAIFIDADFGPAVLRRYLRGGWAAKLSADRYWFTGVGASRPFREFDLLRRMSDDGLRVPAPLAALCEQRGLLYRGALLTRRIDGARPWPERFADPDLDWYRIGSALRDFHDAGVDHADLNARNVLFMDRENQPWLLDFDRSRYTPGQPVAGSRNLTRLKRSLDKLWMGDPDRLERLWGVLLSGHGE